MKQLDQSLLHGLKKMISSRRKVTKEDEHRYLNVSEHTRAELTNWVGDKQHEVISMGQNCNTSWYIKAAGLKRASYPFDWIFTTPDIAADIIRDDFQKLLDKSLIIPHGMDAGHNMYHETLFGHRNPVRSAEDYAYYQRCVSRWRELMRLHKPCILVTTVLNEPEKRPRYRNGFIKQFSMPGMLAADSYEGLSKLILSINPNCRFLFIEQYTERPFELSLTVHDQQIAWIRFCSIGKNTGVRYLVDVDEQAVLNIYKALAGTAVSDQRR